MAKYAVYSRDEVVGYSELESGDPPSAEADSSLIEVNVLGISSALYEKLFPEHVIAYARQFN
jgi:hypothetical protein